MIRTHTIRHSFRRLAPQYPRPDSGPKYVAVALAGVFAIVPAGLAQALPGVNLPQATPPGGRMIHSCDCPSSEA